MIGLSLSWCIQDIIEGKVALDALDKIIAGTRCPNPVDWDRVIQRYRDQCWGANPDLAEKIVRRLLAEGRIEQPRLENDRHHPSVLQKNCVRWVEAEGDIEWSDQK
ncbi:MAG: hypothetical protein WC480_00445 [Patescibacteria group bacterium]